jgi:hypothetical protein
MDNGHTWNDNSRENNYLKKLKSGSIFYFYFINLFSWIGIPINN